MKRKIHSLSELKNEMELLKAHREMKELKLRLDVKNLTEQLKPANLVKSAFSSLTGDRDLKNQVAARGTEAALGFLFTNLIFKNANPIVRTAAALVGTAAASKIFGKDSPKYIEKVKHLFEKFKKKKNKPTETDSGFNEEDIYSGGE